VGRYRDRLERSAEGWLFAARSFDLLRMRRDDRDKGRRYPAALVADPIVARGPEVT
jgi:hypothetical protein